MFRSRAPLLAALAAALLAAPVLASHVEPRVVDGSTSCGPLVPGTLELLVDAGELTVGTIAEGEFEAQVSLEGTLEDGTLAFSDATLPVTAAFVAGATSGNLYEYPEPVTEDDGLVGPEGEPITSVSFCYVTDAGGGEASADATASADAVETGSPEATADTAGGEGTPPPTDTEPVTAQPSPFALGLIVTGLASLAIAALMLASPARVAALRARVQGTPDGSSRRRRGGSWRR